MNPSSRPQDTTEDNARNNGHDRATMHVSKGPWLIRQQTREAYQATHAAINQAVKKGERGVEMEAKDSP